MSDSVRPHRWQPTRLPCPWDSPDKNTGVGCHFLLQCRKVKSESEVAQSFQTLSDPMDCSLPVSSNHGIFQARVLEWGAIAFSNRRSRCIYIHIYFIYTIVHMHIYAHIFHWIILILIHIKKDISKLNFNMQSIKNVLKYAVLFCRTSVVGKQVLLAALV